MGDWAWTPECEFWIKGEDCAQAYGCKITWIRHHSPELIVKDGWSEVERISLERMRSSQEIDRLMQSRGFKHTDSYREKLRSKRDVTFDTKTGVRPRHDLPCKSKKRGLPSRPERASPFVWSTPRSPRGGRGRRLLCARGVRRLGARGHMGGYLGHRWPG